MLERALGAIAALEAMVASGQAAEPALFRRVIAVIEMQNDSQSKKREYEVLAARP